MIVFILVLALLIYFIQRWVLDNALNNVEYDCRLSKSLIGPDDEFDIITTITNNSFMFIPFIRVEEIFPGEIVFKNLDFFAARMDAKGNTRNVSTIYLMPKSKLVRRITVSLPNRGRFIFRGGELKGGDFLGLNENSKQYPLFREVVVYPRETSVSDIASLVGSFMGDISVRRFILEDPILTIGAREYTGREPMKAISWTQSAKLGKLMVNQYDYTMESAISLILDIEVDEPTENISEKRELCYSIARTVCQYFEEKGMKYDFITNAATADAFSRWGYISEGTGIRHYSVILEGLGRAVGDNVETFSQIITELSSRKDYERSAILITLKSAARCELDLSYFRQKTGGHIYIIEAGDYE